jgi:NAD(P)-dependent dehydrogenase (short-subunit alcohol dehydrogenase family)
LRVIDVNLLGTWRVTAAAIEALRESRGRVVNVASGLAHLTVPLATAYTISKRGVVAYSDSLRLENAPRPGDLAQGHGGLRDLSPHAAPAYGSADGKAGRGDRAPRPFRSIRDGRRSSRAAEGERRLGHVAPMAAHQPVAGPVACT